MRTIRNLLKKPVFLAENADWFSEFSSVFKQYNNTIHLSIRMTPIQGSKKANEKLVHSILQDRRDRHLPKFNLGQLVRTAKIKRVFSLGDSTNYSYKLYTITKVIHDTIPSYTIDNFPRGIMKIYYYQQNYLLKKTIKL